MCPDRHDYGGDSPRYSSAARRDEDLEFERDDPEMDRVIRRWWWAAGISWLVAICVVYLTFCHKPPQEPSTSAARPAAPAAVAQSGPGQSGSGASGQSAATGGQSVGDGPMSNGYRVGPDGRLLQPDQGNLMPPELPEEAKQHTPEGAQAYAEHYIALLSYALRTGDTDELKASYSNECSTCRERTDRIEEQYAKGGWIDGQGYIPAKSYPGVQQKDEDQSLRRLHVLIELQIPAYSHYRPDTSLESRAEARAEIVISTCWNNNAWTTCATTTKD